MDRPRAAGGGTVLGGRAWRALRRHGEPLGLLPLLLALWVACTDLPAPLRTEGGADTAEPSEQSVRFYDQAGRVVREVRAGDGARAYDLPEHAEQSVLAKALVLAEDRRFRWHPGVDPYGVARAAWHNASGARLQGASTLTMQLARALEPHPRTAWGKLGEAVLALRIEASLSKDQVLRGYLQHAPFGPQLRGASAAAEQLFGKGVLQLSPAEAATLAALPKAPGRYLSASGAERLRTRRDWILEALRDSAAIDDAQLARALSEPLPSGLAGAGFRMQHVVEALRSGRLPGLPRGARRVQLSLEPALQDDVQQLVRTQVERLTERAVTAAAVVVLNNADGRILAYVGSPRFDAPDGQNDGVLALRQPGSTLKPLVYAHGLARQVLQPNSVLPDVPLQLASEHGSYAPRNYDGRFHGPVRLREALGNSYNVPAVWAADRIGVGEVLDALRRFGLRSLTDTADHYGAALALGDGEVRLLELAEAYATLARGGAWLPAQAVLAQDDGAGELRTVEPPAPRPVLDPAIAVVVGDMLADRDARAAAFGRHNTLQFSYPVAAKTGTSKGFRDNLTAGYSSEITVAVWVGNFDGSPMRDVSGITGAGPLFRAVMERAMQGRVGAALPSPDPARYQRERVCPLSGRALGAHCPHATDEWIDTRELARFRAEACDMHELVAVAVDGGRASRERPCGGGSERVVERYPEALRGWAEGAGRELAPSHWSPLCPPTAHESELGQELGAVRAGMRIELPRDGARYQLDPGQPAASQALMVRLRGAAPPLHVELDGQVLPSQGSSAHVPLRPGEHRLTVRDAHGQRAESRFSVR